MVFKRRHPKSWLRFFAEALWPRGGWARAFHYMRHRLKRLPDSPERIARGIAAGVFTTFTPFYGMHFICAALIAKLSRGNLLAALTATFFGNPLTYVPIGIISMKTGHFLLGSRMPEGSGRSFVGKFYDAGLNLWNNFVAIFSGEPAQWGSLKVFFAEVFLPYLVGGVIPGMVAGVLCYWLSLPLIRAYQKRRKSKLDARPQNKPPY